MFARHKLSTGAVEEAQPGRRKLCCHAWGVDVQSHLSLNTSSSVSCLRPDGHQAFISDLSGQSSPPGFCEGQTAPRHTAFWLLC